MVVHRHRFAVELNTTPDRGIVQSVDLEAETLISRIKNSVNASTGMPSPCVSVYVQQQNMSIVTSATKARHTIAEVNGSGPGKRPVSFICENPVSAGNTHYPTSLWPI